MRGGAGDRPLREAMAAAAERDSIASEYVTDFALTFEVGLPALRNLTRDAIVELHLRLLAHTPDTLIARKAGADAAEQVSAGAREVLAGRRTLAELRRLAAHAGQCAEPGDDRRPRHGDALRRAGRG